MKNSFQKLFIFGKISALKINFTFILIWFIFKFAFGHGCVGEMNCDTPSTDTLEFIELKSDTPNFIQDDFIVVLFNGSTSGGDTSYFTIDLTGFSTDVNGLITYW